MSRFPSSRVLLLFVVERLYVVEQRFRDLLVDVEVERLRSAGWLGLRSLGRDHSA